jgi:hypothetical protein
MREAKRITRTRQRGFVLIASAIAAVIVIGALGMAVDLGRMFVVKTETQNFVDSMALEAAAELDGTSAGILRAANVTTQSTQKYDLGQHPFQEVTTRFALAPEGPWVEANSASLRSRFVRVTATTRPRLYFMPIVVSQERATVVATAAGAQVEKTSFREGLFPFSPFAHDPVDSADDGHFGLTPGGLYTLRWPANPKLPNAGGQGSNMCPDDRTQYIHDLATATGSEERGFIEQTSASVIRQTIVNDYQSVYRTIGDIVDMTGGAKQTMLDALQTRINQDTDPTSPTYAQYFSGGRGNGRRLVGVPINDGGTPPGTDLRMVNIGLFFLRPTGEYGSGGNQAWCAEYVGAWVQGVNHKGVEDSGAWVVRLVK